MKRPIHGPSLYYATDKNIFDALNEHKIDTNTVLDLFQRRNTLVSVKEKRQDLAEYFSRLAHDYYDHKDIASRLGVVARRERVTTMDISCVLTGDDIDRAIKEVQGNLEHYGDVTRSYKAGDSIFLSVQYSQVDYRRSEFNQVQVRDGIIELQKTSDGFVIRSTQNEYMNSVRDMILSKMESAAAAPIEKHVISLFGYPSPDVRSKFFFNLVNGLNRYTTLDVTDVYVYKPGLEDEESVDVDTHVERVTLKGTGVSRSDMLSSLAIDGYYIVKIGWKVRETDGAGHIYDIEAVFADPVSCADFSFIVLGVYQNDSGWPSKHRRVPFKDEITQIARAIEARSRELLKGLASDEASIGAVVED